MYGIVEHLKLLASVTPTKSEDEQLPEVAPPKPLQPSEIIEEYLGTGYEGHEGFKQLKNGDCISAFCILGMDMSTGARFNRVIRGRRDLEKLMDELASEGY